MSTHKISLITSPIALLACLMLAACASAPAQAQNATVTVTVDGVANADGILLGQLCADAASLGGGACAYSANAPARKGSVDIVFKDVKPGTYAFRMFHDANSDGRLAIPAEGYAYGNNQQYPPAFDKAAMKVAGDTHTSVKLIYMSSSAANGAEIGAAPPPGVNKTDVRANGLYGALYTPAGSTAKLPAIIAIGGSEGGLDAISAISESFATRGYAVLALAYWRAPGLPKTLENIPLEYFDKAVAWMNARQDVDAPISA